MWYVLRTSVYYRKFRYIQRYSCPVQIHSAMLWTRCNACIFRTLPHSEFDIFRIEDVVKTMSRHILLIQNAVNNLHNENPTIFRSLAHLGPYMYSEFCLFKHIEAYSDIFNNNSYNNVKIFFTLILHTFQRNLKSPVLFDYNTSISMVDWVYLKFNNALSLQIVS